MKTLNWFQVAKELFMNGHWKTFSGNIDGIPAVACDHCMIKTKVTEPIQHMKHCLIGQAQDQFLNSESKSVDGRDVVAVPNLYFLPIEIIQFYRNGGMNIDQLILVSSHMVILVAQCIMDEWNLTELDGWKLKHTNMQDFTQEKWEEYIKS